jgi:hypothetical protein
MVSIPFSPALADVAPPRGYVETCVMGKQERPGQECVWCENGRVDTVRGMCTDQMALPARGYRKRCNTRGSTVWTEIWCRGRKPRQAAAGLAGTWEAMPVVSGRGDRCQQRLVVAADGRFAKDIDRGDRGQCRQTGRIFVEAGLLVFHIEENSCVVGKWPPADNRAVGRPMDKATFTLGTGRAACRYQRRK